MRQLLMCTRSAELCAQPQPEPGGSSLGPLWRARELLRRNHDGSKERGVCVSEPGGNSPSAMRVELARVGGRVVVLRKVGWRGRRPRD